MKRFFELIFALLFIGGLSGCISPSPVVVTDTVGPVPISRLPSAKGTLIVYTEFESSFGDPENPRRAEYRVSSLDDKVIAIVPGPSAYSDPDSVELEPGLYKVTTRVSRLGRVVVPVKVDARRRTVVYLDGSGNVATSDQGRPVVTLPTGMIVGDRATP